jgi:hypothetical protein
MYDIAPVEGLYDDVELGMFYQKLHSKKLKSHIKSFLKRPNITRRQSLAMALNRCNGQANEYTLILGKTVFVLLFNSITLVEDSIVYRRFESIVELHYFGPHRWSSLLSIDLDQT